MIDISKTTNSHFPIRELSELTGVNSVTLRAWERRYGLLKPKRSSKGHRFYDQGDLETVKTILAWIGKGVAVGKVKPLLQKIGAIDETAIDQKWPQYQQSFLHAAGEFNENKIDALYKKITKQYPLKVCSHFCFYPLFETFETNPDTPIELIYLYNAIKQRMQSTLLFQNKKLTKKQPVLLFSHASQNNWKMWLTALNFTDNSYYTLVYEDAYTIETMVEMSNTIKASALVIYTDEKIKTLDFRPINTLNDTTNLNISGTDIWLNKQKSSLKIIRDYIIYSPLEAIESIGIKP